MAGLAPNVGAQLILEVALNKTAQANATLKLFQNDYTPVETSTNAAFTEATFTGYSAITLTGASWSVTNADPAVASYAQQTFTSSAGSQSQPIYGYYIVVGTVVVFAERFSDGPYTIVNNGDQIKVTPQITGD